MAKLVQLSSEASRRRALKLAGQVPDKSEAATGQLDLFRDREVTARSPAILTFSDPFVKALYLHEQNHPQAPEAYREAIRKDVHVADAYCNLAILHAGVGEDLEAMDLLAQAIINDPRHAEAHYNLANLYMDHGDLRLSRLHYELALRCNPAFPEAYFNLGLLYLLRNDKRQAVQMLRKYEDLVPGGLNEIEELLKDNRTKLS